MRVGAPVRGKTVSDDQLLAQDIKWGVDAQLAQKGLTRVEKQETFWCAIRLRWTKKRA